MILVIAILTLQHLRITRESGGDPYASGAGKSLLAVLPARAGVIPGTRLSIKFIDSITRESGGDPSIRILSASCGMYYPRERG